MIPGGSSCTAPTWVVRRCVLYLFRGLLIFSCPPYLLELGPIHVAENEVVCRGQEQRKDRQRQAGRVGGRQREQQRRGVGGRVYWG